jgi:hypothetical protein
MSDLLMNKASLIGQVIEDLSYEGLSLRRFTVELKESNAQPRYKEGGFFVFSNIRGGAYLLRITGQGFQSQQYPVSIPFAPLFFNLPGANEVIVIIKTVDSTEKSITFDEIILTREVKKGSSVLAEGFTTALAKQLETGKVTRAKLDSIDGLVPGDVVRIVCDNAIRMRFNPYFRFPFEPTRIVGKVAQQAAPDHTLEGAIIRINQINGAVVDLTKVADAKIATVKVGAKKIVLGSESDITTFTNENGDYNFYFNKADFIQSVGLTASLAGYQVKSQVVAINPGERKKADFNLTSL